MPTPPRIALLCATRRGLAFARALHALQPDAEIAFATFPEEPGEPRYVDELRAFAAGIGRRCRVARQIAAVDLFAGDEFDLLFAVSWRYVVRPDVYRRARRGAFVFHDSLLPKRRGFAPTPWAIIEGDNATGATLLEMAEAVDRGRIVDQVTVPIAPDEYIASVVARVTAAYLQLLARHLPALLAGAVSFRPQDEAEATYGAKRRLENNRIVWDAPAETVFNLIRACSTPYPGAFCFRAGQRLIVWKADPPELRSRNQAIAGTVLAHLPGVGVHVAARDGVLRLREVQAENGPVVRADEMLQPAEILT